MVTPVYKLANPYCFNHWQWGKQIIIRVCVTQHAGAREIRFVVFTRALLCVCVNLPRTLFYTRTTHCPLRRGNCQQKSWKDQSNDGLKMTALELTMWIKSQTIIAALLFILYNSPIRGDSPLYWYSNYNIAGFGQSLTSTIGKVWKYTLYTGLNIFKKGKHNNTFWPGWYIYSLYKILI